MGSVDIDTPLIVPTSPSLGALATALLPRSERGGRKVAWVQEGGGMRGSFGSGVQAAFEDAGIPTDAFDGLWGSSAAAFNFMYWVSGLANLGTRVYAEELPDPREPAFFKFRGAWDLFRRLMRGQPVMNLLAVADAMEHRKPIRKDRVRNHPYPIWFPITEARSLETRIFDARTLSPEMLLPTLCAASSVPVLADAFELNRSQWLDGACGAPLMVAQAMEAGFTDLVVTLTLPPDEAPAWYETKVLMFLAERRGISPKVGAVVQSGRAARVRAMAVLKDPPPGLRITVIAPPSGPVGSLETNRARIERSITMGREAGMRAVVAARQQIGGLA